jgi:hypothetical protein
MITRTTKNSDAEEIANMRHKEIAGNEQADIESKTALKDTEWSKDTAGLGKKDQVKISRIRTGYTRATHGYILKNTVPQIPLLWRNRTETQREEHEVTLISFSQLKNTCEFYHEFDDSKFLTVIFIKKISFLFPRIQRQTVLSGPDIQSTKVSIHTTNTFIKAARIITQIELRIVGIQMKSTEVDLGNNIVDKYREK